MHFLRINMSITQQERSRKAYQRRRDNHLCPRCGKPLQESDGFYCQECREKNIQYRRESREFYRKNNICTSGGKIIVPGSDRTCPECRAKKANRKKLTEEQKIRYRENHKSKQRAIYRQRVQQGICTRCGMRKAMPDRKKCSICLEKDAREHRKLRESKHDWVKNGRCYKCGKPVYKEYKVCKDCYDKNYEALKKARQCQKNDHFKELNMIYFKGRKHYGGN